MTPTFQTESADLWAAFVNFSNDHNNTTVQVIAAEYQYDKDYEALLTKYAISHPPSLPDRRR